MSEVSIDYDVLSGSVTRFNDSLEPVSYTHLDVYKKQLQNLIMNFSMVV